MKKVQTKDVREVLNYDGKIIVDEYNYFTLYTLYNYYLRFKDTKLTYNDVDLKEYARSHKHGIGAPDPEEWEALADKEINKILKSVSRGYLIGCLLFAEALAGVLNYSNHEYINIENSKNILTNSEDTNGNGFREIDLDRVGEYDEFVEPTSDFLYSVTNPFYYLSDKNKIASAYSLHEAAKELHLEAIEYNGDIYTHTGKLSYATYEQDGNRYMIALPYEFDSKEHGYEMVNYFLEKSSDINHFSNVDFIGTIDVKKYDELPTIYKSKTDNTITTKPANKVLNKLKKYFK